MQRIGTILHLDVTGEAVLAREYLKVQRLRRQQWLRELLLLGLSADFEIAGHQKDANAGALEKLRHQTLRIQIYLDARMEREAAILSAYLALPRSRRGRWVLEALMLGYQIKNGIANARLPELGSLILRPRRLPAPVAMEEQTAFHTAVEEETRSDERVESTPPNLPPVPAPIHTPVLSQPPGGPVAPVHASMLRGLMGFTQAVEQG